mgnify:CR=1 FL=1
MSTRTRHGAFLPVAAALAAVLTLATSVAAQTPYIPYHGKNQVRYDNFEWWTYETDHFTIYYYGAVEPHLAPDAMVVVKHFWRTDLHTSAMWTAILSRQTSPRRPLRPIPIHCPRSPTRSPARWRDARWSAGPRTPG